MNNLLRRAPASAIMTDMDTIGQMLQMIQAGWALQVLPMGNGRAWLQWSRARDEVDTLLDGAGAIPFLQQIALIQFADAVAEFHARVFPISPIGDLPADSPFRDL